MWSYTPLTWRIAQVVPIHKKGAPDSPANFRPISLTSVLRKLLELCLKDELLYHSPDIDIAQGGFRIARSTLDQALCLTEICQLLRSYHGIDPLLAFLDIKAAYDSADRRIIWASLQPTAPPPLLSLLQNMFDKVEIEVLLNNTTSTRFSPNTGVLQGSLLSPHLFSLYINELPRLLRPHPFSQRMAMANQIPSLNCLLYADDVVLISKPDEMQHLLDVCEQFGNRSGFRWNPAKSVILTSSTTTVPFRLYGEIIPTRTSFSYLGIPFSPNGTINPSELITQNMNKALATLSALSKIGFHKNGFSLLTASRFYKQLVRAQLEYGLAITKFTASNLSQLEKAQDRCIRCIFGGAATSSTKVMLTITGISLMTERVQILQAQFLNRVLALPDDALLFLLLPVIQEDRRSQWGKLAAGPLWSEFQTLNPPLLPALIKKVKRQFLQSSLNNRRTRPKSKLLSFCRLKASVDPLLWLPMSRSERSRCIRWRLGWLPGYTHFCPKHPSEHLTKHHALACLSVHHQLMLPESIDDPISFLFNLLPIRPVKSSIVLATWCIRWPILCSILMQLDQMYHGSSSDDIPESIGQTFVQWISSNSF